MTDLPHGLTEALHYLEPFAWRRALAVALGLALALVVWRLWRLRRQSVTPSVPASPAPPAAGVAAELDHLRRRHLELGSYRAGCHDLSALLRAHLERTRKRPFSRWTAREVERTVGDTVWSRLLSLVAGLQFSRRPPGRSDFEGACELAREVIAVERS